jgi:hypothetical protein
MSSTTLTEIEQRLTELSLDEQLRLLKRLASLVRVRAGGSGDRIDPELAAMAADPEIQRELRAIEAEFRITEADGLEALE